MTNTPVPHEDAPWLVETPAQLQALRERLGRPAWLAVDTEFLRENTYYPRLCLVQVAVPGLAACIDPLAISDLEPLLDLMYDPGVLKVFHAASQDLEIFYHLRGAVPGPVFDTQIAAPLLGYPAQMGYAALAQAVLGVSLDKSHARTDWSKRPLSRKQLSYAADDVIHLAAIYPAVSQRLVELGRLDWLASDFEQLGDPHRYLLPLDQAWTRVKAAGRLKGRKLAVLKAIARWREELARRQDRPKGWILKDDVLLDLATQRPRSPADLEHIRGLPVRTRERHGGELLSLIAGADRQAAPVEPDPGAPRLTPEQEVLVDLAMAALRLLCAPENVNPAAIAGRRDLERLVVGERDLDLLKGWRRALAGERLLDLLAGRTQIVVSGGRPGLAGT